MTRPAIDLIHLVWAPLGPDPLRRFISSYLSHPAGAEHRLVLALNGFGDTDRAPWDAVLSGVEHQRVEVPQPEQDLTAYRHVALAGPASRLCFTNSYAEVLADGWLGALSDALDAPGVGLAGATGTWESTFSAAPVWLKPRRLRDFGRFPNPHVRTSSFMLDRELMLGLDWPDVGQDKLAALRLENGRHNITRQVAGRGFATVVVGRDGRAYLPEEWPESATFRAGGQRNLLVADNRTAEYERADPRRRAELARFAWGTSAVGA